MMAAKIILLPGLFMPACFLSPLRHRLEAQGFFCGIFGYHSVRHDCATNAARLIPRLRAFAAGERVHFVAHSLGGLVVRHIYEQAPDLFHHSCVVTLGSPHLGSCVAARLRPFFAPLLRGAWPRGLDGHAPAWPSDVPLLSVAGSKARGIGRALRLLALDDCNDGTVLRRETQLQGARAGQTLAASHTMMLYHVETAKIIAHWIRAEAF